MDESKTNEALLQLAGKISIPTPDYRETIKILTGRPACIESITRAFEKQMEFQRNILGPIDGLLNKMEGHHKNLICIQALSNANSRIASIAEKISIPDVAFSSVFAQQERIKNTLGIKGAEAAVNAIGRIDTTRMLSISLVAQAKLDNLRDLNFERFSGFNSLISNRLTSNLEHLTSSYKSLINYADTLANVTKCFQ